MEKTKKWLVALLDWEKLYPGVIMDAGNAALAPGIWVVALCTQAYKVYEVWAPGHNLAADRNFLFKECNIGDPRPYRDRSLSVGDLLIEPDDGRVFLCCSVGWFELPKEVTGSVPFRVLTKGE